MEGDFLMGKHVYISADYSEDDGDRDVIEELHAWGSDNKHKVDYCDTAQVVSGSVSDDEDCRACDLKKEFNKQINASSAAIFVIGDKTASRLAGSTCKRQSDGEGCDCTPFKQNTKGTSICKIWGNTSKPGPNEDVGCINTYSYIEHEFKQADKKNKKIIVVYNSLYNKSSWLPDYMSEYEEVAHPFWTKNDNGEIVGNYKFIKTALGYE